MDRRAFIVAAAGLLAAPLAAGAQQAGKIPRIGLLRPDARPEPGKLHNPAVERFRQGLRSLGYVEGHSVFLEWRYADGRLERLPDLAAELVRFPVDVIAVSNYSTVQAARDATHTIPIVVWGVGDLVEQGLVQSLARPGGNITGLSDPTFELSLKLLEVLKDALPRTSRLAYIINPANPSFTSPLFAELNKIWESKARSIGLQPQQLRVRDPSEFTTAFAAARGRRADVLFLPSDPMFIKQRTVFTRLALEQRMPTIFLERIFVDGGGLLSYAPKYDEMDFRAAVYVDKILKGAKPADLPVEQPTKFELVINLRTAKLLGLTIPESLRLRATDLIE